MLSNVGLEIIRGGLAEPERSQKMWTYRKVVLILAVISAAFIAVSMLIPEAVFSYVFGDAWGKVAFILTPIFMIYSSKMVSSPMSHIFIYLSRQREAFIFVLMLAAMSATSIIVCGRLGLGFVDTVTLNAAAIFFGNVVYAVRCYWLVRRI